MRAIHNTQESGGHQKEIAKCETAADYGGIGNHSRTGSGAEVSVPDSEIGCCVPLATSCKNRFGPQLRARNRHHLRNDDPALKW
jgi:hypothetical protein